MKTMKGGFTRAHAFARKYYELVTERKQQHEATEL